MADPNNINVDSMYRTAEAERGKFWVVDGDYLSSLNYPASGRGKYAILTYQVNSAPVTISGDVTMGAVELKDETSEDRVNIVPSVDGNNAMAVAVVDLSGNQILPSSVIAETTVPSGVADGAIVAPWYDEFGRQIIAGYNTTEGAINVNTINDIHLQRTVPLELHVSTDGNDVSDDFPLMGYSKIKIHIYASIASDFDFIIRHQISSDTGWYTILSDSYSLTGETMEISLSEEVFGTIQTEVANLSGGGVNAVMIAGN